MSHPESLIVGIGSPHGDDQAGWLVVDQLSKTCRQRHVAMGKASAPVDLLDWIDGIEQLVVCDASRGLGQVGTIRRWSWPNDGLQQARWSGTHDLSLPEVLQLAQRLDRLPHQVAIWSVEAAERGSLKMPSPEVTAVIPRLVVNIAYEVQAKSSARAPIANPTTR